MVDVSGRNPQGPMKVERQCFYDHLRACRGPEAWHKQYAFLNRLIKRWGRERRWI